MKIILLLGLISVLSVSQQQHLYEDNIANQTFQARVNEMLKIKYLPEDEVLNVKIKPILTEDKNKLLNFWKLQQQQEFCKAVNRGIKEQFLNYQLLDKRDKIRSTVMVNKTVYMLLEDQSIQQYQLDICQTHQVNFLQVDTITQLQIENKDQLSLDDQDQLHLDNNYQSQRQGQGSKLLVDRQASQVYLLTNTQLYQLNEQVLTSLNDNLVIRNNTHSSYIKGGLFFRANGPEGIDVYQQQQYQSNDNASNGFLYCSTWNETTLDISSMDVRDVYLGQDYLLYVLCHNTGVHIYRLGSKTNTILNKMVNIPIKSGTKLKVKDIDNLLFVIGRQDVGGVYMVKEVVLQINEENVNYLVNREYHDSHQYFDVQFAKNYVLIVGEDLHRVLFHQTSQKILPEEESVSGYLIEKDTQYIKLFIQDDQYYMLTVSNNMLRIYQVQEQPAGVQCLADSYYQTGQYLYTADIVTRNCRAKSQAVDLSNLSACHQRHYIQVTLYQGFSYDDKKIVLLLILIVIIFFLFFFFFLFNRYKRNTNLTISTLQQQCDQYQHIAYKSMNNSEEPQSQSQMSQQQTFNIEITEQESSINNQDK